MTKLFYEDIYQTAFSATVTACICDVQTKYYQIVLDRTAFFPEEGGQSADVGTLNGIPILDVQIKDDTIFHIMEDAITVGTIVQGQVDWGQRFDFMQQHSGEHIISGLVHKHFHYDNVGFHLGLQEVTLDFNGTITLEQLRVIEQEANEAVWKNLPISIHYPNSEELSQLSYRSKLDLKKNVRLVEIPDIDLCACCAPHCVTTGQIGLIKITNVQNHRGGVRVNILCGKRAVMDYTKKQYSVADISVQLSAKQDAVVEAVSRLKEENLHLKELGNTLQSQLLYNAVKTLPTPEESNHAVLFIEIMNEIALRNVLNELATQYSGFCAGFAGNDSDGYRFIIGSSTKDCRELAATLRTTLQAKGGGSAAMIQGTLQNTQQEIINFFANL